MLVLVGVEDNVLVKVGVGVSVFVRVGVNVGVGVLVSVFVSVGVLVFVGVDVVVLVKVGVEVVVLVNVGVFVGVGVGPLTNNLTVLLVTLYPSLGSLLTTRKYLPLREVEILFKSKEPFTTPGVTLDVPYDVSSTFVQLIPSLEICHTVLGVLYMESTIVKT